MPCIQGRAQHNLCKPDCSVAGPCECQVREAFHAREVCCNDSQVNTQLTLEDARDMMCDYVSNTVSSPYATVDDLAEELCTGTPPHFNCPLSVNIEGSTGVTGTVGPFEVAVIDKGVCTSRGTDTLEVGANSNYVLDIDGIVCTTFINN